jgi:hypothetical protein
MLGSSRLLKSSGLSEGTAALEDACISRVEPSLEAVEDAIEIQKR